MRKTSNLQPSTSNLIATILVALLMFASCNKAPINGDLDGMWQLTTIEHFDTEGNLVDTQRQKNIFWSFQLHLVQFGDGKYFAHFTCHSDSLFIYDLVSASAHEHDGQNDDWITAQRLPEMHTYGIYQLAPRYKVEKLNEDALRLHNADVRLIFRKY